MPNAVPNGRDVGALVAVCAMLCGAAPAFAQSEASVAYQFARVSFTGESLNFPVGVAADYAHAVSSKVRLVGVVDWLRKHEAGQVEAANETFAQDVTITQFTLGGGVRVDAGRGPYVQAVAGVAHNSIRVILNGANVAEPASTDFMVSPGAGFTIPVAARVRILGEIGFRFIWPHANSDLFFNESVHDIHALVGARIRLD
jgi:hypothetical protein